VLYSLPKSASQELVENTIENITVHLKANIIAHTIGYFSAEDPIFEKNGISGYW